MACSTDVSLPQSVICYFPVYYTDGTTGGVWSNEVTLASLDITNAKGTPGSKIFQCASPAWFTAPSCSSSSSYSSSPLNQSDLVNLSQQLATDYYTYQGESFDLVFNGLTAWTFEGLTDCCEIQYTGNNFTTRYTSPPLNQYFEKSLSYSCRTSVPDGTTAIAKTTTTVSARSGTTTGSGKATIQYLGSNGVLTAGDCVTVRNPYGSSIANATYIVITQVNSSWTVIGSDC